MLKRLQVLLTALVLSVSSMVSVAADHPAQALVVDAITSMLDVLKNDGDKIKSDPDYRQGRWTS